MNLTSADLVIVEAPPMATNGFEKPRLRFISKFQSLSLRVEPSITSEETMNFMRDAPSRFRQSCSCRTGNKVKECQLLGCIGGITEAHISPVVKFRH